MTLSTNNLKPNAGSRKRSLKVGRGNWSWKWTYSWRWCNWQNCRSWWWVPDWFEWGQTPLFRRMPKLKGFSNKNFMKNYNVINIKDLEKLAEKGITEITTEILIENRIIRNKTLEVKLLADWKITKSINIKISKATKSAVEAVEKAWGKVELI